MAKVKLTPKACITCSKEFSPVRQWQVYCSAKCRVNQWDSIHPRQTSPLAAKGKDTSWSDIMSAVTLLQGALTLHPDPAYKDKVAKALHALGH